MLPAHASTTHKADTAMLCKCTAQGSSHLWIRVMCPCMLWCMSCTEAHHASVPHLWQGWLAVLLQVLSRAGALPLPPVSGAHQSYCIATAPLEATSRCRELIQASATPTRTAGAPSCRHCQRASRAVNSSVTPSSWCESCRKAAPYSCSGTLSTFPSVALQASTSASPGANKGAQTAHRLSQGDMKLQVLLIHVDNTGLFPVLRAAAVTVCRRGRVGRGSKRRHAYC